MITFGINFILSLTSSVFFIGLIGIVLNRKNILITIMSIELLLLAVNLNFASFSIYLDDIMGQIFIIFVLTIAATESAVGLSLLAISYKLKSSIELKSVKQKIIIKI